MKTTLTLIVVTLSLAVRSADADEPLKPGYKIDEFLQPFFREHRATGPVTGEKNLLVCTYSTHPVAMVYTRRIDAPVIRLIKKLDEATNKHQAEKMGSYVVLLCDSVDRAKDLKALAEKEKIEQTLLSLVVAPTPDGTEFGWQKFQARFGAAETTVILATAQRRVKACYAFRKGELTDKDVNQILADLPKILSQKNE